MKTVDKISRRYHESRHAAEAQESLRRKYRRIDLAFAAIGVLATTAALALAYWLGWLQILWEAVLPYLRALGLG